LHQKEERLAIAEDDLVGKEGRLTKLNALLQEKVQLIEKKDENLSSKEKKLTQQHQQLTFKEEEIEKLNKLLLEANTQRDTLNGKMIIVQNLLEKTKIEQKKSEKELRDYQGKVIVLSSQLTDANKTAVLKEEKMLRLMNALDEKETNYNKIVENLQKQKAQIKNLTGIKVKVIAALKKELGSQITIDPKNG